MRKKGIHFLSVGIGIRVIQDSLTHWIFEVGDDIGDRVNEFSGSLKCGELLD